MRGQGFDEAQSCLTEPGEAVEWGVRRVVAIGVAWAAPPQKTGRGPGRWAPNSGPGRWHGSREDGLLPSPPGLFANAHSLWGFAGQASRRMRPQPLADRGDEEAATSRVWEGKLCTLPPRHKSAPSNCPWEKLLQILSWLVAQLLAAKCPSAQ